MTSRGWASRSSRSASGPSGCAPSPATEIARECLGRPLPNAVLLGGFAALSGLISLDSLAEAIRGRFAGRLGEGNVAAAERAHELVSAESGSSPMLRQIEGSQGMAEAVALCRPEVICAYPISPQTHIVEGLSRS